MLIVVFLTGCTILCVQAAQLRFFQGSLDIYTAVPLDEPLKLLPLFNKSRVSMFYAFGYNEAADSDSSTPILSAYLETDYTNVIQLDWQKEAAVTEAGPLSYPVSAVPNAEKVGKRFGKSLVKLIKNGISQDTIHLVGHSLGAQLLSYAAVTVQSFNYNLSRITGLDPAGPEFSGREGKKGLNANQAQFVDVLHTNPGCYGINKPVGTVDFWANCGDNIQPGCFLSKEQALCSHYRSWKLFAEAILSPTAFPAASELDCKQWKKNNGRTSQVIYLGDQVDRSAWGNFYFSTKRHYPFAKRGAGLRPNNLLLADIIAFFYKLFVQDEPQYICNVFNIVFNYII